MDRVTNECQTESGGRRRDEVGSCQNDPGIGQEDLLENRAHEGAVGRCSKGRSVQETR